MSEPTYPQDPVAQITDRVERLLARHAELQHTNRLLVEEVTRLQRERDSLKSSFNAARVRLDALLDRLGLTSTGSIRE